MPVKLRIHLALKVCITKERDVINHVIHSITTGFIMPVSQSDKQSSKQGKKLGDKLLRFFPFSSCLFIKWPVLADSTFMSLLGSSISTTLGGVVSIEQKLWRKSVISMNSGRNFGSSAQHDSKRWTRSFGRS
jgi:hypothetical protein